MSESYLDFETISLQPRMDLLVHVPKSSQLSIPFSLIGQKQIYRARYFYVVLFPKTLDYFLVFSSDPDNNAKNSHPQKVRAFAYERQNQVCRVKADFFATRIFDIYGIYLSSSIQYLYSPCLECETSLRNVFLLKIHLPF